MIPPVAAAAPPEAQEGDAWGLEARRDREL